MTAFPITYLGAPLSTGPLPKSQYRPLIDKVASKLPAWQGRLMSRSGRLTLVKSTLYVANLLDYVGEIAKVGH